MDKKDQQQEDRIVVKKDVYGAAKKNQGGAAYNILNLNYDSNKEGQRLRGLDEDAKVRAQMRSKNLDQKANQRFNILTGEERPSVQVPFHDRYNPIAGAGAQISGSHRSQRSSGVLPGMNY